MLDKMLQYLTVKVRELVAERDHLLQENARLRHHLGEQRNDGQWRRLPDLKPITTKLVKFQVYDNGPLPSTDRE